MKVAKGIFSITDMVEFGYPEDMLRKLSHSEDFSRFGFRSSDKKNAKIYINKEKLERFLEMREDERAMA